MTAATARAHPVDEILAAFASALRSGGLAVTADRTQAFLTAASVAGADEERSVFWAGRATLCGCHDDIERYDAAFAAWFGGEGLTKPPARELTRRVVQADLSDDPGGSRDGEGGDDHAVVRVAASDQEVLRHRDIAEMSAAERAEVARIFARLQPLIPRRRSVRHRPSRRGGVDGPATLRDQLRHGGEPARLRFRTTSTRPRRIVVLVDVSGSMGPYADSQLRWAHRISRANLGRTEVFTIGTRLTRITKAMCLRDPEAALTAAGQSVPDWSGGTRLGEAMAAFLGRWGRRGAARQAVVVVMSDGWERGDSAQLAEQMKQLHRLAHRVVWINPHQGKSGYQPVQSGIVAVLPYVDSFLAGHSVATFEEALKVIADA